MKLGFGLDTRSGWDIERGALEVEMHSEKTRKRKIEAQRKRITQMTSKRRSEESVGNYEKGFGNSTYGDEESKKEKERGFDLIVCAEIDPRWV
jgi:hypothetical protein